ncbi:uncharacterized protein LOC113370283 [Ctenocephalides felis]|uniref:uncharacterized protein LOC113370283 n=1 Tax=Ctenocephalides felis TaxID=7515 RepID=UPI000E6E220D|nr:uncharacterized protein LOC113370283 [Ctenocephalides felis]
MSSAKLIVFVLSAAAIVINICSADQPYYITQCSRTDPAINTCLQKTGNRLARLLKNGVPELGIEEVEPVVVDEIGISLGAGPDGYRAVFKDIQAFGVSNLTVTGVRSDVESLQFQLTLEIPKISVQAQYRSSGVLILVRASGAGDYWGEYEGVKTKVYFRAAPLRVSDDGNTILKVEQVKMDFSVRDIKMGVDNVANGNTILQAALNLFINSNAQELLREMKPALRTKLAALMASFMNRLFEKVPLEHWLD